MTLTGAGAAAAGPVCGVWGYKEQASFVTKQLARNADRRAHPHIHTANSSALRAPCPSASLSQLSAGPSNFQGPAPGRGIAHTASRIQAQRHSRGRYYRTRHDTCPSFPHTGLPHTYVTHPCLAALVRVDSWRGKLVGPWQGTPGQRTPEQGTPGQDKPAAWGRSEGRWPWASPLVVCMAACSARRQREVWRHPCSACWERIATPWRPLPGRAAFSS